MDRQEHRFLLAERSELEQLLEIVPKTHTLDIMSLQSRLDSVNAKLESAPEFGREPRHTKLIFRGGPVVASQGVFAKFGAIAVEKFIDTVAVITASIVKPLKPTGAIPKHGQLLITNTIKGSFGFELEEHIPSDQPQLALDVLSPVEESISQVRSLMEASVEADDDELAYVASGFDPRAINKLHDFIKMMLDNEATCALAFHGKSFRFRDVGDVARSANRLSQDNLHEELKELSGEFVGCIPGRCNFQFQILPENQIIYGKTSESIENVDAINHILYKPCRIKVLSIRSGNGKSKYRLLSFNTEPE